MTRRNAFTLIELLVVIAIIAILAGIIFPVFGRAKDSANRSSDLNKMNELRSALLLYQVDAGGYPPALLGFVNRYATGPSAGSVVPADRLTGFLFPKRVSSLDVFRPIALRDYKPADITTAVWPTADARAVGAAPLVDLNGDGSINAADDTANARQAYNPTNSVLVRPSAPVGPTNPMAEYYKISGYDVAELPTKSATPRWELRYTLFWSNYAIGQGAGLGGGSSLDDPRQLGYADPPDNTVITWNSYYRDWIRINATTVLPEASKRDIVLFLGGNARPYDSREAHLRSWRLIP